MAISVKVLDDLPQFRGHKVATGILEEIMNVMELEEKLLTFTQYQHEWNQAMKCEDNILDISNFPKFDSSVVAGKLMDASETTQKKKQAKSKAKAQTTQQKKNGTKG